MAVLLHTPSKYDSGRIARSLVNHRVRFAFREIEDLGTFEFRAHESLAVLQHIFRNQDDLLHLLIEEQFV